jgi:hypothetical protein
VARFRQTTPSDWASAGSKLLIFVAAMVLAITVVRPWKGTGLAVFFILAVTVTLVVWHTRAYGYQCAACGKVFQVPAMVNFFTPGGVGHNPDGTYHAWKSLTCPYCGKRSRARVLKRAELRGSGQLLRARRK